MSDAVFPVLPGLAWDVKKAPIFNTRVQQAASGRELRVGFYSYPLWKFSLAYNVLKADTVNAELQQLMGFFLERGGQFDSFLYSDPTDHQVSGQQFGTGDGSTTAFQLTRTLGGYAMPVNDLNGSPTVYVGGAVQDTASYSISTGLVTFTTPPANGAALTWEGAFYYRCRFLADTAEFNNFAYQLWELQQLEFQSVKL